MINEIFQNLINTRKVASFINDVITGMEWEEEHKIVVEEVVKRLVENDLYVNQKNISRRLGKWSF